MSVSIPSLPLAASLGRTDTVLAPERGTDGERVQVQRLGGQSHDIAVARRTTNQSLITTTLVEVDLTSEVVDSNNMFTVNAGQGRFTAQKAGIYMCTLTYSFLSRVGGTRVVQLHNHTTSTQLHEWAYPPDSTGRAAGSCVWVENLALGHVIRWLMYHDTGSNLDINNVRASFQFLHDQ